MMLRLVIAALAVLALAQLLRAAEAADEVARVNGVVITTREFIEAQQRLRFRYGTDSERLRTAALAACVDFQVRLQLAREHGLVEGTGADFVRRAFETENERRSGIKASAGVVYGPLRLTWPQFRRYWLDGIERRLLEAINLASGPEPQADLRQFYAGHIALFTAPGETQPRPFAEIEGHVRDQFRQARYDRVVREAVAAARVESNPSVLAALGPETPL